MSRKSAIQKRPLTRRDSRRPLSATLFPAGVSGNVRAYGGSRRILREPGGLWSPLPVAGGLLLLLLSVGGWLGWQVNAGRVELAREREMGDGLTRSNRELTAQRDRLLVKDRILAKAAVLGLYPPRPEQIRKLDHR